MNSVNIVRGGNIVGSYSTIQEAINAAQSHDSILVSAGTFNEQVTINKSNLSIIGSPNQTSEITGGIVVDAAGAVINGFKVSGFESSENATVFVLAADATIQNNAIVKVAGAATGVVVGGGHGHATINNNAINGFDAGVYVNPSNDAGSIVTNNHFSSNSEALIFESGPSVSNVSSNTFTDSSTNDIRVSLRTEGTTDLTGAISAGMIGQNTFSGGTVPQLNIRASDGTTVTAPGIGTKIEVATVGSYDHSHPGVVFHGGFGDDTLIGGSGNDTLDGGIGIDTVVYSGARANYTVQAIANGYTVTNTTTHEADTLLNVEYIQFNGEKLDLSHSVQLVRNGAAVDTFSTIQSAVDAARSGDSIRVSAGTFNERVTVNTAGLTISGAIQTSSEITGGVVINAAGTTIEGFKLSGSMADNEDSNVFVLAQDATIRNNAIVTNHNATTGIVVGGGHGHAIIFGNTISGFSAGVYVNPSSDTGSVLLQNNFTGNGEGLIFEAGPSVSSVSGNTFTGSSTNDIRVSLRTEGMTDLSTVIATTAGTNTFSGGTVTQLDIRASDGTTVTAPEIASKIEVATVGSYTHANPGAVFRGGTGNDILVGGAGNDTLDGGAGNDTAVYSGARSNYSISVANSIVTVKDNRVSGDGTDTVTNVELFSFADQIVSLADVADAAPPSGGGGGGGTTTPPATGQNPPPLAPTGGTATPTAGQVQTGDSIATGSVTLDGSGTLVLTGTSTYTGPTTVNAGTLVVDGSIVSPVTVNSGGTLGGHGSTGTATIGAGGTLSPGNSPGILSTKDLTLAVGSALKEELGGTASGQFDQTKVTGTVTLNGATLNLASFGSFVSKRGDSFTIIDNDGTDAVQGSFAGLSEGARLGLGNHSYRINYHGGDGNDVTLTDVTLPDAATLKLFGTLETSVTSKAAGVYALYEGLLGRTPDALGLEGFSASLSNGASLTDVAQSILASPERAAQNTVGFVQSLYGNLLHRQADAGGLQFFTNELNQGVSQATVAVQIATSTEAQGVIKPDFDSGVFVPDAISSGVARLYQGLLGRAPDAPGLQAFEAQVKQAAASGGFAGALQGLSNTANAVLNSPEYVAAHAGQTSTAFVDSLYVNALGRHADAGGAAFFADQLAHGTSRATVALEITQSPEAQVHLVGVVQDGFHLVG